MGRKSRVEVERRSRESRIQMRHQSPAHPFKAVWTPQRLYLQQSFQRFLCKRLVQDHLIKKLTQKNCQHSKKHQFQFLRLFTWFSFLLFFFTLFSFLHALSSLKIGTVLFWNLTFKIYIKFHIETEFPFDSC